MLCVSSFTRRASTELVGVVHLLPPRNHRRGLRFVHCPRCSPKDFHCVFDIVVVLVRHIVHGAMVGGSAALHARAGHDYIVRTPARNCHLHVTHYVRTPSPAILHGFAWQTPVGWLPPQPGAGAWPAVASDAVVCAIPKKIVKPLFVEWQNVVIRVRVLHDIVDEKADHNVNGKVVKERVMGPLTVCGGSNFNMQLNLHVESFFVVSIEILNRGASSFTDYGAPELAHLAWACHCSLSFDPLPVKVSALEDAGETSEGELWGVHGTQAGTPPPPHREGALRKLMTYGVGAAWGRTGSEGDTAPLLGTSLTTREDNERHVRKTRVQRLWEIVTRSVTGPKKSHMFLHYCNCKPEDTITQKRSVTVSAHVDGASSDAGADGRFRLKPESLAGIVFAGPRIEPRPCLGFIDFA